jgi:transcriptional regulator with XRE-family HTH domain
MERKMRIDLDLAAELIRLTLTHQRRSQTDLARAVGIDRTVLNKFLNRRFNLLPEEIEKIFDELNLWQVLQSECIQQLMKSLSGCSCIIDFDLSSLCAE